MTALVTKQVVSLFIIMIVGFVASGIGFFDKRASDGMSKLLVYVTNPLLIFMAFTNSGKGRLGEMLTVVGCSAIIHIALTLIALLFFRNKPPREANALRFSLIFSNCGYMGYPILAAVFPENGLFYGACYVLFFNLYMWTVGVFMLSAGKRGATAVSLRRAFLNPGIIAAVLGLVLSLTGIGLPSVVSTAFNSVADLTFPMAMLILGNMLKEAPLKKLVAYPAAYGIAFLKMLMLPLLVLLICGVFKVATGTAYICVIMAAMPVAAKAPILADNYGADKTAALSAVALTTIVSIFTIPLVLSLTKAILGA